MSAEHENSTAPVVDNDTAKMVDTTAAHTKEEGKEAEIGEKRKADVTVDGDDKK